METKKLQKGVALNIALLISMFVLSLALGMSVIVFSQMRMMGEIGHSVVAFYAADTGIEKALYMKWVKKIDGWATTESVPIDGASYNVSYNLPIWKSVGAYGNTRRAIEIREEILDFQLSFVPPCGQCYKTGPIRWDDCAEVWHPVVFFDSDMTIASVYAEVTGGSGGDVTFSYIPGPGLNLDDVVFEYDTCALNCDSIIYIYYNNGDSINGDYILTICGESGPAMSCENLTVTIDSMRFCPP